MKNHASASKQPAFTVFFPTASLYAAIVIPLSIISMTSNNAWLAGLMNYGHGREMLFGFVPALIAGYTLGPVGHRLLFTLFALWLCARLVQLALPGSLIADLFNALFLIMLAIQIVPKFKAAKKWRNRIMGPLLFFICLLPIMNTLFRQHPVAHVLLNQEILLFALLMAFVGGRLIAAAVGAEADRLKLRLTNRVQPGVESLIIVLLITAVLLRGLYDPTAALLCVAAGIALLIRLWRWRIWRCRHWPDLLGLVLGYTWLGVGLIALGTADMFGEQYSITAIHILTVGALGSLSIGVMMRLHSQHQRTGFPDVYAMIAITLISGATITRLAATMDTQHRLWWLWLAAACWSAAYTMVAWLFLYNSAMK